MRSTIHVGTEIICTTLLWTYESNQHEVIFQSSYILGLRIEQNCFGAGYTHLLGLLAEIQWRSADRLKDGEKKKMYVLNVSAQNNVSALKNYFVLIQLD